MPLTASQIAVMKSDTVRIYRSAFSADFTYFDNLLRDMGPNCPRLPAVWQKVFPSGDAKVRQWFTSAFPGVAYSPGEQVTLTGGAPAPKQPNPIHQNNPTSGVVGKAMTVIQSYRRS